MYQSREFLAHQERYLGSLMELADRKGPKVKSSDYFVRMIIRRRSSRIWPSFPTPTMSSSSSSSSPAAEAEEELTLTVKWSGKDYTVRVCGDDSIGELKRRICQLTNVLPKRQKLLYPKVMGSRLSNDAILLSELPLKSSLKMTMIGYFKIVAILLA